MEENIPAVIQELRVKYSVDWSKRDRTAYSNPTKRPQSKKDGTQKPRSAIKK